MWKNLARTLLNLYVFARDRNTETLSGFNDKEDERDEKREASAVDERIGNGDSDGMSPGSHDSIGNDV